jgi:CSLREA domain-containing protein
MNLKYLPIVFVLAGLTTAANATVNLTFTVNSVADSVDSHPGDGVCMDASSQCSLRAAIMEANALAGPDTIVFDPITDGQPIQLQLHGVSEDLAVKGDLDITEGLTITGNGSDKTIIDGDGADRIFDINPASGTAFNVQIDNVTMQNGSEAVTGIGGGIQVQKATLTLQNDLIQKNQATLPGSSATGGGIYGRDASITLDNTTVEGNSVTAGNLAAGGGIDFDTSSGTYTLTIRNGSIISSNSATSSGANSSEGGGVQVESGNTLVMDSSAIRGNTALNTYSAEYAYGGGLSIDDASYLISNSEISGNTAEGGAGALGGGVDSEHSTADSAFVNSTISGNSAIGDGSSASVYGGGISVNPNNLVTVLFANMTMADNSVSGTYTYAGGLEVYSASGTVKLQNTLIAGNSEASSTSPDCYAPSITSGGYNLIGDGTGCNFASSTGDQVGAGAMPIDPLLSSRADNGGQTQTMELLVGSPAIDTGNPAGCADASGATLTSDQRGDTRPTDGDGNGTTTCDVGAYERTTEHAPTATGGSISTSVGTAASGTLQGSDADGDAITFAVASNPMHGTLALTDASKGTFTYTPNTSYSGSDNFTFTANDGYLDSKAVTEGISVKSAAGSGGGGSIGIFMLVGLLLAGVVARGQLRAVINQRSHKKK